MISLRRTSLVAAAVTLAVTLAACSGQAGGTTSTSGGGSGTGIKTGQFGGQELANGKPIEGGTFTYGLLGPVQALDPAGSVGNSIDYVMTAVFGTLMKLQPDGSVAPNLADSLSTTDNKTWTLKLPAGLKFTDGTPFDANAVITHEKNVAAPGSASIQAAFARTVVNMTAPDAQTVQFTLNAPNNQFGLLLAEGSMAMIPSPTAKASEGAGFAVKPVGAGAFKVDSFTPGGEINLSKNTGYKFASQGLPYLSKVKLQTVLDQSSRIAGVKSGSLDAASVSSIPELKNAASQGLTTLKEPSFQGEYLMMNNKDSVLSNLQVRTAIAEAIDRASINKAVYQGEQSPMNTLLVPGQPYEKEAPKMPAFNVAKAKKAMKAAGVGKVDLTIMVTPGDDGAQIAPIVQQMLAKIGITVKVKPTDPTAQVGLYAQGKWQASIVPRPIPAETTNTLAQYYRTGSSRNWSAVSIPAFDDLVAKAASAASDNAREALIPQELKVLTDNVVSVPLVSAGAGRVLGPRVKGFPDGNPDTPTVESYDLSRVWVTK